MSRAYKNAWLKEMLVTFNPNMLMFQKSSLGVLKLKCLPSMGTMVPLESMQLLDEDV